MCPFRFTFIPIAPLAIGVFVSLCLKHSNNVQSYTQNAARGNSPRCNITTTCCIFTKQALHDKKAQRTVDMVEIFFLEKSPFHRGNKESQIQLWTFHRQCHEPRAGYKRKGSSIEEHRPENTKQKADPDRSLPFELLCQTLWLSRQA